MLLGETSVVRGSVAPLEGERSRKRPHVDAVDRNQAGRWIEARDPRRQCPCRTEELGGEAKAALGLTTGLVVGALAKAIMPGKDPGGILITMVIGVVGALLAGFLGRSLGWYHEGETAGFIASILGAIILLAGYRVIAGRRAGGAPAVLR